MFEISAMARFSAAHHIEGYEGSCAAHHGHNWDVEVFVRGERLDEKGILVDFRRVKQVMARTLEEVDHTDLNTVAGLGGANPTSECIAEFLYGRFSADLNCGSYRVHRVLVRETSETSASYWEGGAVSQDD